jgi:hypothetical protein
MSGWLISRARTETTLHRSSLARLGAETLAFLQSDSRGVAARTDAGRATLGVTPSSGWRAGGIFLAEGYVYRYQLMYRCKRSITSGRSSRSFPASWKRLESVK